MLVIFDCDGVLVDSEALAAKAFSQALAEVGIDCSPDWCRTAFQGFTLNACFEQLVRFGHRLPLGFADRLLRVEMDLFEAQLKPVTGVEAVLEGLQQEGIPYCVASNGKIAKIQRSLTLTGLGRFFEDNVYSAEQVSQGKPSPELFLFAAESMGVPAAFCTVIEDSSAGITAALSARMRVVHYSPEGPTKGIPADVSRCENMNALMGLIRQL